MKKQLAFILSILLLTASLSCKQSKQPVSNTTEETEIANNLAEKTPILPITPRYLSLIKHVDSLGYIFDTVRYTPQPSTSFKVDNYVFFDIPKETTTPFIVAKPDNEENYLLFHDDLLEGFSLAPFEKAEKVTQYYFKRKDPEIINNQKWYTDGLIEEWTFNNEDDAEAATKALIKSVRGYIYFNTGAFVCGTDKQMYIFHSRAMAFMYTQKTFFDWFIAQNSIQLYAQSSGYDMYPSE